MQLLTVQFVNEYADNLMNSITVGFNKANHRWCDIDTCRWSYHQNNFRWCDIDTCRRSYHQNNFVDQSVGNN